MLDRASVETNARGNTMLKRRENGRDGPSPALLEKALRKEVAERLPHHRRKRQEENRRKEMLTGLHAHSTSKESALKEMTAIFGMFQFASSLRTESAPRTNVPFCMHNPRTQQTPVTLPRQPLPGPRGAPSHLRKAPLRRGEGARVGTETDPRRLAQRAWHN